MTQTAVWGAASLFFAWSAVHDASGFYAWAAVSLGALAAAYGAEAAGRPAARALTASPGRAFLWQAALVPWSLCAAFVLALSRLITCEAQADQVVTGLWLGSAPLPGDAGALRDKGVEAVLSLTAELPDLAGVAWSLHRKRVAMLDAVAPLPEDLDAAVEWACARRREGRSLFVHCAQGHGRSALVVAAVLVKEGRGAEEAWGLVKKARPGVGLKPSQQAALDSYALRAPARPT